jgi:hypothetical protein
MMKFQYLILVVIAGLALSSCANQKETMVVTTTDPTVHTRDELKKTGETQTGPALEKADPAVQTSGHP